MIDPFIGKTIGRYEIVAHIGRGATADVYKAYQATLDRYVAIKLLHPFLADDTDFLDRFQREAKAAARLRHPNIVQVYDFDVIQDVYYLVMEYIDGLTLKTALQNLAARAQAVPLPEAVRITRAVASALTFAHAHDMIHRDIKPANIMLTRDNQVILTDFGTAKILGGGQHTASGVTTGTPAYASPEQVMALPGDPRSDLYSLGVVFFQMVTGRLPYDADTGVAVFLKHLTERIPSPRAINPALSIDVETIVFRAMAKKAEDRYQTADELIADLDRISGGQTVADAPRPSGDTTPLDLGRYLSSYARDTGPLITPLPGPTPMSFATPPITTSYQLPPYTLSPGNVITEPADLPAACQADWARAVNHFAKGYITSWLREGVTRLRAEHQHGLADDLEAITSGAEGLIQHITPDDEISRNSALQEFLMSLGAAPPALFVAPDRLEAPPLGAEETGEPLTVTIVNRERGYLFGQVVSTVPWLKVLTTHFGCASGEQALIRVQPNAHGLTIGRVEAAAGLVVRSVGGEKRLPATVDVLPAVLHADVAQLEFGTVGLGTTGQVTFTITNRGHGQLVGTLRSLQPWLTISPTNFRLPSRSTQAITCTADPQSLSDGANTFNHALVVESNGGQLVLGAQLRVRPPRLKFEPAAIDFGTLDLAVPNVGRTVEVALSNQGPGVLMGVLKPEEDWLSVEPAAFRCQTGQTQRVSFVTGKVKTGSYAQAVRVIANAGDTDLPVRLEVVFSLEPETVAVPAGPFFRGSPAVTPEEEEPIEPPAPRPTDSLLARALRSETRPTRGAPRPPDEQPQTEIYLSAYRIGRYPVTNQEYSVFVAATGRHPPAHWADGRYPPELAQHPVVNVTWFDALAYCAWLAEMTGKPYRLPSEAQWEKAARGEDRRSYPWGARWDRGRCNTLERGLHATTPVGAFSPDGDSVYGCADMAGNVWEWVLDWYSRDYYAVSTAFTDPLGPTHGAVKVIRGGSFNADSRQARVTTRAYANRNMGRAELGFRVALDGSA